MKIMILVVEKKQNKSLDLKWVDTKLFNYYKECCNILFTVDNKIINESAKVFLDALKYQSYLNY